MYNINSSLLKQLLRKNNYNLNEYLIESRLLSHPDFPNVNSITDTLDELSVQNLALEFKERNLDQIQNAFLALIKQNEHYFYVIVEKNKRRKLTIFKGDEKRSIEEVDESIFFAHWTGIAVLIDPDSKLSRFHISNNMLLCGALICLLLIPFLLNQSLLLSLNYFLNLTGCLISLLIFQYQIGYRGDFLHKFCADGI